MPVRYDWWILEQFRPVETMHNKKRTYLAYYCCVIWVLPLASVVSQIRRQKQVGLFVLHYYVFAMVQAQLVAVFIFG